MVKALAPEEHIDPFESPLREEVQRQDSDSLEPPTVPQSPVEIRPKTPTIEERITQIKETRAKKRNELSGAAKQYPHIKALQEHSAEAIKYIQKSQGMNGIRLLREQKDNERVQALKELPDAGELLKTAQAILEDTQRIHADQQSRRFSNHRNYQRQVSEIRALITKKALVGEIQAKITALEAYDKQLKQDYEGLDPYPAPFGRFQRSVDSAMSWFVDADMRPSPADLLIEYSLSTHGLERTSDSYMAAFNQLWQTDLQTFKSRASTALSDIWKFIDEHPVLAAQMASQLAYMAIYMSGDSGLGALVQRAIAQKRYEYRALDLLRGKGYTHAYAPEFEHPLTVSQIALLDFLSKAPYLAAMAQGASGRDTWGARIGAAVGRAVGFMTSFFGGGSTAITAGDYIGSVLGGMAGAVSEVVAQNVLAESIDRDLEVWASALSFSLSEADIGKVGESLQTLQRDFGFNWATMSNLMATAVSAFGFMKPGFRAFAQRGQAEKLYEVLKDFEERGLLEAVRGSAQRSYSSDVSAALVPEIAEPGLFAINLFKFMKAFRLIPQSVFESLTREDMGSFYEFYDKLKLLDARPGHVLQGAKGILSQFLDVETMAFLENNKNFLAKIPAKMVQTIRSGAEEAAFWVLLSPYGS